MRKRRTRLLRLPDGRRLEYIEFGAPQGTPLLYFHGCLGSCYQAALLHERALVEGIHIIAPNRPGIGRSSPRMFASMTEYARDIGHLADALQLTSFAVMGASGGGGFALSAAYALADRARVVGIAGGLGPLDSGRNFRELHWTRRAVITACSKHPRWSGIALGLLFRFCRTHPRLLYYYLQWTSSVVAPDQSMRRTLEQVLWWDFQNVFLQPSGIMGLLNEMSLYFRWGFRPRDFPPDIPVIAWHGREDMVVPWSISRRTVGSLRRAKRVLYSGGHLVFLSQLQDIFATVKRELELTPAGTLGLFKFSAWKR